MAFLSSRVIARDGAAPVAARLASIAPHASPMGRADWEVGRQMSLAIATVDGWERDLDRVRGGGVSFFQLMQRHAACLTPH
jgi:hypothetical protein